MQKTYNLSEQTIERLEELRELIGHKSQTAIIENAVFYYHKKECENYVTVIKNRTPKASASKQSPEERAQKRAEAYEAERIARKETEYKRALAICEQMNAEVITNANGTKRAEYSVYEYLSDSVIIKGSQSTPLEHLTDAHVEMQYRGATRAHIEACIQNGATVQIA